MDINADYNLLLDTNDQDNSPLDSAPQKALQGQGIVSAVDAPPSEVARTPGLSLSPKCSILKKAGSPNGSSVECGADVNRTGRGSGVTFTIEENQEEVQTSLKEAADALNHTDLGEVGESDGTTLLLGVRTKDHVTNHHQSRTRKRPPPLRKLKSELDLEQLGRNEIELKANLYFHIGNPIKRWKIERVIPVKLMLQLIKTFCLIAQVALFTITIPHQRAEFFYNSREVFENLFLPLDMVNTDDQPRGIYTAFSIQDLFKTFNHVCDNYYQIPNITIGGYDFELAHGDPVPVKVTLRQYTNVTLNASNFSYVLDGHLRTVVYYVHEGENASERYMEVSNDTLFNRFFDLTMQFPIRNIRIVHRDRAECFTLTVKIQFMTEHDSGKVNYYLRESHEKQPCDGVVINGSNSLEIIVGLLTVLDAMLIIMSFLSMFLTFSTLKRAVKLARAMGTFYQEQLHIKLSWSERRSLFSAWHCLNFLGDLLIVIGTVYKIALNLNWVVMASPARVFLGTAVLFQAGVILRYASYFKQLNALNRTLYLAFPELLKFMLCAGLLFMAFCLAGYIVLGPFHTKFATFYETFETLFSLLNGDDIYTTFDLIDIDDDPVAYIYSRLFLYAFLILFIYFVLNLFTSLVISAYEASQHTDNAAKNEVRRFIFSGALTPNGVALRDVTLTKKYVDPQEILQRREKQKEAKVKPRSYSFVDGFSTAA